MRTKHAVTIETEPRIPLEEAPPVEVRPYAASDREAWSQYLGKHPQATFFHTLDWDEIIRRTFSHESRFLIAHRDGQISGILPLTRVSSAFFGTSLISVPFGVYGGLLVDDQKSADALLKAAGEVVATEKAKYAELRHLHRPDIDLPRNELYATFIEDVPGDAEGCLARLPRKARAEVRKCLKDELLTAEEEGISLEDFHRLFSLNKRKLGSPLFPSSLFWHIRDVLGAENAPILTVKRDGRVLATVMSFVFQDTIMPYYSGSAPDADRFRGNNFMYFKLMEWASERGLKKFDFGRSRVETGSFSFKKHQGFEPIPLSYDYLLAEGEEIPSLNPSNPKFRMAKRVFRRMPLWMAQKVGSWLVKRAPF
ncbi:MAG: FemAB family XrtA/PEP-CTERM system-associated protein [Planctomycetota bacterium]